MPKPGIVVEVDRSTPPIMLWRGEYLTAERFPIGSRIIYGPDSPEVLTEVDTAIAAALDHPLESEPLRAQLRPDMKLTVAFDDSPAPSSISVEPDNRQRVIEAVLEVAAAVGVDDVELIVARGLNRRFHDNELCRIVGERVFDSFFRNGGLKHHDAEDEENLVTVGKPIDGHHIEINKRVADSDLLVFVTINADVDGIHALLNSLTSARTARALQTSTSATIEKISQLVSNTLNVFQVETTTHDNTVLNRFDFLQKRESLWSIKDKAQFAATKTIGEFLSPRLQRKSLNLLRGQQPMTGIFAGSAKSSHKAARDYFNGNQVTLLDSPADIVSIGVPFSGPFAARSILNPLLATYAALKNVSSFNRATSIVRDGGILIVHHPMRAQFSPTHHPSYIDFFEQVLPETRDIKDIEANYEEKFAHDTWYQQLYRRSNAYHGIHPIMTWRACSRELERLAGVIVVGGNNDSVHRLGLRSVSNFNDALELAGDLLEKPNPSLIHLHVPPTFAVDVK